MAKKVVQDLFTKRLLEVYNALIAKQAIPKKKIFTGAILFPASIFRELEFKERNYPKDELKRKEVEKNLQSVFYVNPAYLQGKSEKMFLQEPISYADAPTEEVVVTNFNNKEVKRKVIEERDKYKRLFEEASAELYMVREELAEYKTKPDSKTDKKVKKR